MRGAYVLKADLVKVNIERRRRAEATEEWRKRYDIRAGIEGTNSELKRAHGLGRLRVRGGRRVRLAVYLKALACNFSRVPGSGVRGRGSGERETTASSLAGKEERSRKEDNSGQGKDGPAGAIAQGGNGR